MSNKTARISDKLIQWEAEKNPLAPLSSSQINAYLSLSEQLANTDFVVCIIIIVMNEISSFYNVQLNIYLFFQSLEVSDLNEEKQDLDDESQILDRNIESAEDVSIY